MRKVSKLMKKAFTNTTKKEVHNQADNINTGENQISQSLNLNKSKHASYRVETPPPKNLAEQLAMRIHQGALTISSEENLTNPQENIDIYDKKLSNQENKTLNQDSLLNTTKNFENALVALKPENLPNPSYIDELMRSYEEGCEIDPQEATKSRAHLEESFTELQEKLTSQKDKDGHLLLTQESTKLMSDII